MFGEKLLIPCSVELASWADWRESVLTPTPQCSAGVLVCLSLPLWFSDTDLAEPILLVILYWIQAPGDPEEPPRFRSPLLFTGLADRAGYSRLGAFALQLEPQGVCWYKDSVPSPKEEVKGPTPEEVSLFSLYVCNNSQSCLRQTDVLDIYILVHAARWRNPAEHDLPCAQFLLHAFHTRSEKFAWSLMG